MNSYSHNLAEVYDEIYSGKSYGAECNFILNEAPQRKRLLDIGAGTLTHSAILGRSFEEILAIDYSLDMLEVGHKKISKLGLENVTISHSPLESISGEALFSCAIAMFNVVNHILSIGELLVFFQALKRLVEPSGALIFDCWNGAACRIDAPSEHAVKEFSSGPRRFKIETATSTDLLWGESRMETQIKVEDESSHSSEFTFSLEHRLWTPDVLLGIAETTGFKLVKMVSAKDFNKAAALEDYRLMFVFKRENA